MGDRQGPIRFVDALRGSALDRFLPKENAYRGLSLTRVAGVRIRVALEWLVQSSANQRLMRDRLQRTKALENTSLGKPAVILATGPSLKTLDLESLDVLRKQGGRVFALNFYNETAAALQARPDYYVLADPTFLAGWQDSQRTIEVWNYILREPRPTVCVPAHVSVDDLPQGCNFLFFNSLGLDGWTKNISPLRPRGFLGLTAYHAISIALFLGFDPVFTLGIDNDAFKSVEAESNGELALTGHHAYADRRRYPLPASALEISAMLEDYARHFADVDLVPSGRLVDLATTTLVTAYAQGSLRQWLNAKVGMGEIT